jgi:hypothetical protein
LEFEWQPLKFEGGTLQCEGRLLECEGRPLEFEGQPAKFEGCPLEFEGRPSKFEGRPSKFVGRPLKFARRPLEFEVRPLKFEGRRSKFEGRPLKLEGQPLQCEGRSLEFETWSLEFGVEGPVPAFPRKHSVDNTPKCLSLVRIGAAGGGTMKICTDVRLFQCPHFCLYFVSSHFLFHSPIPFLFPFVFVWIALFSKKIMHNRNSRPRNMVQNVFVLGNCKRECLGDYRENCLS